jgi:hypothetical protein
MRKYSPHCMISGFYGFLEGWKWKYSAVCLRLDFQLGTEGARPSSEPGNRLPRDVTVLFKTLLNSFYCLRRLVNVCSAHCSNSGLGVTAYQVCRCAVIVLQNGCRVANRVTDFCGESIIQGITKKISGQRAGRLSVCVRACSGVH